MTDNPTYPAGWYPDTNAPGTERYFDGTYWTAESRPIAPVATDVVTAADPAAKRPWYKRKGIIIPVGIVAGFILLVGIIGSLNGAGDDTTAADPVSTSQSQDPSEEPAADAAIVVPQVDGKTVEDARNLLTALGFEVLVMPADAPDDATVSTHSPDQTELPKGSVVSLIVESEAGTLDAPYERGHAMSIFQGDESNTLADVTVAVKDWDAGAAIAQANQFNEAAQPGYHYVAVEYTFTGRNKTEPANVSLLLYDWSLATDDGTLIAESNTSVVLPDGWNQTYDVNDLYDGQTGAAVVVYQVPDTAGALFATAYGKYVTL